MEACVGTPASTRRAFHAVNISAGGLVGNEAHQAPTLNPDFNPGSCNPKTKTLNTPHSTLNIQHSTLNTRPCALYPQTDPQRAPGAERHSVINRWGLAARDPEPCVLYSKTDPRGATGAEHHSNVSGWALAARAASTLDPEPCTLNLTPHQALSVTVSSIAGAALRAPGTLKLTLEAHQAMSVTATWVDGALLLAPGTEPQPRTSTPGVASPKQKPWNPKH